MNIFKLIFKGNKIIAKNGSMIRSLESDLAERDKDVDLLKSLADNRYNELEELRGRIIALDDSIDDRDSDINALTAERDDLDSQLKVLTKTLERVVGMRFRVLVKNLRSVERAREVVEMIEHKIFDFESREG